MKKRCRVRNNAPRCDIRTRAVELAWQNVSKYVSLHMQPAGSFMKILVIEDTITSATLICRMLDKLGCTTILARDGHQGIDAFRTESPDLVLLDLIMPGMDGFEVARHIRQLERDGGWTPIIFLSARANDEDLARAIEEGGDDYLVKPVSEIVLGAKVKAMQRIAHMRHTLLQLTRKLDEANRELVRLSQVDGLTGVANRRNFDETLEREWRRAARIAQPVSVLIVDVDRFKQFNDGYGHQAGDEALRDVAGLLQSALRRPSDLVARYGGEEFAIVLPATDAVGAAGVANNILAALREARIDHAFSDIAPHVTVSIGSASAVPARGDTGGFEGLVRLADEALYAAKRSGRNRLVPAKRTDLRATADED